MSIELPVEHAKLSMIHTGIYITLVVVAQATLKLIWARCKNNRLGFVIDIIVKAYLLVINQAELFGFKFPGQNSPSPNFGLELFSLHLLTTDRYLSSPKLDLL